MVRYLKNHLPGWFSPGLAFLLLGTLTSHAIGGTPGRSVLAESGGRYLTILDDNTLEVVQRVPLRSALQGKPVYSPDGRYLFFTTRDAWLTKFDLQHLQTTAAVQVGSQVLNPAVSGDGKYVAVANLEPQTLAILDADLKPKKVLAAKSRDGKRMSDLLAVYTAAPRESFVVALKDIPEMWEVSYNPTAPEIPMGVIHDFQYREGAFAPGFLNPNRTTLDHVLTDYAFSADFNEVVSTLPSGGTGDVVNLDARRKVASWGSIEDLHLASGYAWMLGGRGVIAAPSLSHHAIQVLEVDTGKTVRDIAVSMQPAFIRSHEKSRYLWVGSAPDSHNAAQLAVVDKLMLEVVSTWQLTPGSVLADIAFSQDGRLAFVTFAGPASHVTVYDSDSRKELKRLTLDESTTERRTAIGAAHQ